MLPKEFWDPKIFRAEMFQALTDPLCTHQSILYRMDQLKDLSLELQAVALGKEKRLSSG